MPPAFPLLLLVPAALMDWLRARFLSQGGDDDAQVGTNPLVETNRRELWLAIAAGAGFLAAFLLTQWFFSEFLLSAAADNRFFAGGGRHWPFFLKIDEARIMYWGVKQDPLTWQAVLIAMLFAVVASWLGLRVGTWLSKVRR